MEFKKGGGHRASPFLQAITCRSYPNHFHVKWLGAVWKVGSSNTTLRRNRLERLHFLDAAGSVAVALDGYRVDGLVDQRLDVHLAFGLLEFFGIGMPRGVSSEEDGRTIVEGFG